MGGGGIISMTFCAERLFVQKVEKQSKGGKIYEKTYFRNMEERNHRDCNAFTLHRDVLLNDRVRIGKRALHRRKRQLVRKRRRYRRFRDRSPGGQGR